MASEKYDCASVFLVRVVHSVLLLNRIDFIFIPKSFSLYVKNSYYKHNTFWDHSCVVLNLDFSELREKMRNRNQQSEPEIEVRSQGLWMFNNTFIDEVCAKKINKLIVNEKLCRIYDNEPLIWCDNSILPQKMLLSTLVLGTLIILKINMFAYG